MLCYANPGNKKKKKKQKQRTMVTKGRAMKHKDHVRKTRLGQVFCIQNILYAPQALQFLFIFVRDRAPGPFYEMLGQAHVNGWSRIIASQNGGSTSYIFSL